jgi:hypothetical protein
MLACTGLEFCKLAIVETKARSVDLYTELEKRLPDFDEPLTINVNGCPNSCARFQTGDIGLKGSIVDGVEGFQVHLGGRLGAEPGFGRKSRGLKVTPTAPSTTSSECCAPTSSTASPTSASPAGRGGPTRSSAMTTLQSPTGLRALAEHAGRVLETASAQDVVRWAVDTFGDGFAIASSMEDGLMAHLASSVAPGVQVVFLDTGYHFPETIGTRDAVAAAYDVRVRTVLPLLTVAAAGREHGAELWRRDPGACCALRKVEPLARALEPYTAWASGCAATRR